MGRYKTLRSLRVIQRPDLSIEYSESSLLLPPEAAAFDPSICHTAPVAESHSLTVPSPDPDATSLPSGENATALTESEWPSSVCSKKLHSCSTLGSLQIQFGIWSWNCLRIILIVGTKTRAEQYIWRGASSIADRLYSANRFASWINSCRRGLSLD